jgi:hypothetical protein
MSARHKPVRPSVIAQGGDREKGEEKQSAHRSNRHSRSDKHGLQQIPQLPLVEEPGGRERQDGRDPDQPEKILREQEHQARCSGGERFPDADLIGARRPVMDRVSISHC